MKGYRIGRKVLQGIGALGAGFLTYKAVSSEDGLDIYNFGIARFGRAAFAVRIIAGKALRFPTGVLNLGETPNFK